MHLYVAGGPISRRQAVLINVYVYDWPAARPQQEYFLAVGNIQFLLSVFSIDGYTGMAGTVPVRTYAVVVKVSALTRRTYSLYGVPVM
jgi:hypothetical protein